MALVASLGFAAAAEAQVSRNQFGAQDRADAATRLIALSVQRAISSLPPPSGQTPTYTYDPRFDTYAVSHQLGPIVFRTPRTIGKGTFTLRTSTSYFELSEGFSPAAYVVRNAANGAPIGFTRFGLDVDAHVGLVAVAADYGLTNWLQAGLVLPIAIVDAEARQVVAISEDDADLPPGQAAVRALPSLEVFDALIENRGLLYRTESFDPPGSRFDSGDPRFREGTFAGVGRIALAAKARLPSLGPFEFGFEPQVLFPSPSEEQFAGSDSVALVGRILARLPFGERGSLLGDVGYDYDFEFAELRRFVWSVGGSVAMPGVTLDLGFGGSSYDEGITWTPRTAAADPTMRYPAGFVLESLDDNTAGTHPIDFLAGVKVKVASRVFLTGAVNVPVGDEQGEPTAAGTIGVEVYL